jgi:hypothetical protein
MPDFFQGESQFSPVYLLNDLIYIPTLIVPDASKLMRSPCIGAPKGVYDNIFDAGGYSELDDSPVSYHITEVYLLVYRDFKTETD